MRSAMSDRSSLAGDASGSLSITCPGVRAAIGWCADRCAFAEPAEQIRAGYADWSRWAHKTWRSASRTRRSETLAGSSPSRVPVSRSEALHAPMLLTRTTSSTQRGHSIMWHHGRLQVGPSHSTLEGASTALGQACPAFGSWPSSPLQALLSTAFATPFSPCRTCGWQAITQGGKRQSVPHEESQADSSKSAGSTGGSSGMRMSHFRALYGLSSGSTVTATRSPTPYGTASVGLPAGSPNPHGGGGCALARNGLDCKHGGVCVSPGLLAATSFGLWLDTQSLTRFAGTCSELRGLPEYAWWHSWLHDVREEAYVVGSLNIGIGPRHPLGRHTLADLIRAPPAEEELMQQMLMGVLDEIRVDLQVETQDYWSEEDVRVQVHTMGLMTVDDPDYFAPTGRMFRTEGMDLVVRMVMDTSECTQMAPSEGRLPMVPHSQTVLIYHALLALYHRYARLGGEAPTLVAIRGPSSRRGLTPQAFEESSAALTASGRRFVRQALGMSLRW